MARCVISQPSLTERLDPRQQRRCISCSDDDRPEGCVPLGTEVETDWLSARAPREERRLAMECASQQGRMAGFRKPTTFQTACINYHDTCTCWLTTVQTDDVFEGSEFIL